MKASYILETEKKIEQLRIEIAKEWAFERGMHDIENIDDEDWIAIYTFLVIKAKYRENF